jgi:hypothetical protein
MNTRQNNGRGRGTEQEGEDTQGNVFYIDDENIMNSPNTISNDASGFDGEVQQTRPIQMTI